MNKRSTLQFWKSTRRKMQIGLGTKGSKVKCPECDEEFSHCQHIVFKRKFRWTIEGETPKGKFEPFFVKVTARPEPVEETEINFLSAKTWIPGKQDWQRITVTAFGMDTGTSDQFWKTIAESLHTPEHGEFPPEKYGTFKLNLYDGCGCLIESWDLSEAYISKINFGELDYSSSEETTVEFDISYKKVVYKNNCGPDGKMKYLPEGLGGSYRPNMATCPNCKHQFAVTSGLGCLGSSNIVF